MATPPLAFSDFRRRCLSLCDERHPPEEAHCPICTEGYDRSEHQALRITLQPPAQCDHEFCRKCLNKIFSRRKTQDNTNICPLCRAIWFQAEYESRSTRNRRLADEAINPSLPNPFIPTTPTVPEQPSSNTTRRASAPVPPPTRRSQPYRRSGRRVPPTNQAQTTAGQTQGSYNWRQSRPYTWRELQAERTVPQAAPPRQPHGLDPTVPPPRTFQFSQQAPPNATASQRSEESSGQPTDDRPATGVFNYPPDERDTARGSERSRAVPPLPAREAELQRRAAALNDREAQLRQGEQRLERERQELQQRQREFDALSEHARQFLRNRDAHM
jgi:hypothetical protein